jgi:ATP phosphoribosyltransferase
MSARDRLRVAVQKSGRLAEPSLNLLRQCGLEFRMSRDKLFCFGETAPVDLLLVRDDDIPGLIAQGVCDLGVVGRNVLEERRREATQDQAQALTELRALGFGHCRLSLAVPQESTWQTPADLHGRRIATSYPKLLEQWLGAQGVPAQIVVLNGSVEIAPRLGTADLICDLVSSGATLIANQLREFDVILRSEAVLAGRVAAFEPAVAATAAMLLRRLDGVRAGQESKLVMMRAPRHAVADIADLLPGRPRPNLTCIDGDADHVALQAVCVGAVTWQLLEDIKRTGASGVLVLPVEKMLA